MTRSHERSTSRGRRRAALCLALLFLLQSVPFRALAATGDDNKDSPPSKAEERGAEQSEALLQSLLSFFFAQQQAAPAPKASPTPSPTPARDAEGRAQPSDTNATAPAKTKNAGTTTDMKKGESKPLQYPLPDWSPLGNAGPKTVKPKDESSEEFIPAPDRWRFPFPRHDRYNPKRETPWVTGSTFDPYNQNVLKADYPVLGNHTFLNLNFQSASNLNPRVVAAAGRREQFFTNQNFVMGAEIFGGDTVFQPKSWAVRVTTVANFNFLAVNTLNPFDSKRGNSRLAVEEAFFEKRLKVVSPNFDFVSLRSTRLINFSRVIILGIQFGLHPREPQKEDVIIPL